MSKRDLKEDCYLEALESHVVSVEMILNRINQIQNVKGKFDDYILQHDKMQTILDLELALAALCVLLRKMAENGFIHLDLDLRRDVNSIIHSNRFEYRPYGVVVFSQKGKENVDLDHLLNFCHQVMLEDDKKPFYEGIR